ELALRVPGVVAAGQGALLRLGDGRRDGLAHLERHHPAPLLLLRLQDLRRAGQAGDALRDGEAPVLLVGVPGALQPALDLGVRVLLELPQPLARGRVDAGDGHLPTPWRRSATRAPPPRTRRARAAPPPPAPPAPRGTPAAPGRARAPA